MPGPGGGGGPQDARDGVLRGDPAMAGNIPPVESPPRVTPSSTRPGWSAGGMAIPALLVVVLLVVLGALFLR